MKTCKVKTGEVLCGKASFSNGSHECEEHFAAKFPVTHARIKRQEIERKSEADRYEAEMIKKRGELNR